MKKIQCQLTSWVSTPPASRPSEPPPAITNVNTLIACARSTGLRKPVTIKARITPEDRAPPAPCRNRAAINVAGSWASPQSTEAAVNSAIPARKTFFRPIRSPALPASSNRLPKVIR